MFALTLVPFALDGDRQRPPWRGSEYHRHDTPNDAAASVA
jgi:hypothetical protein